MPGGPGRSDPDGADYSIRRNGNCLLRWAHIFLFEKEYEYVKALDTISHAVDKVQEGASKKIMEEYSKNHPPMFSK